MNMSVEINATFSICATSFVVLTRDYILINDTLDYLKNTVLEKLELQR